MPDGLSTLERLAMRFRPDLPRRLTPRERAVERVSALLFLAAAAAVLLFVPSEREVDWLLLLGLVAFHALCSQICLYVGPGYGVPSEVPLVVMLFTLPAPVVPLAVAAGVMLSAAGKIARGGEHPERLPVAVGDAWHALGPALVFAAAGEPTAHDVQWPVLLAALGAQFGADVAASILREWAGRGILPRLQLRAMAWVGAVDVTLAPFGLLAAYAAEEVRFGWLLAVPPVLLLGALAQDRRRRIEETAERMHEQRRERERLQEVLRRAGRAFAANLDRETLLSAVAETASEALRAEVGWAGRDPQADPPRASFLTDDGFALVEALTIAHRRARRAGDVAAADYGRWHAIACRLRSGSGRSDAIAVARHERPFSARERELFSHLAAQAGISMENATLHERLRVQAMRDELTGLSNHRHLQEFLDAGLEAARVHEQPFALILLDIDDFKAVNDEHGHQQGDVVLRRVAEVIEECARELDEKARYGGEELAVAMPGAGLEEAELAAERLRREIEKTGVTVSAGVAAFPLCAHDKSALIAAADRALYAAKRAGKNRVVVAAQAEAIAFTYTSASDATP